MAFIEDFKKFAFKGNVVDLAVGVVIGGAFGKIVSALVADLVMPFVALIMPGGDWRTNGIILRHGAKPEDNVVLKYGDFVGSVMGEVVENGTSKLTDADRAAIAAYLAGLPSIANPEAKAVKAE